MEEVIELRGEMREKQRCRFFRFCLIGEIWILLVWVEEIENRNAVVYEKISYMCKMYDSPKSCTISLKATLYGLFGLYCKPHVHTCLVSSLIFYFFPFHCLTFSIFTEIRRFFIIDSETNPLFTCT